MNQKPGWSPGDEAVSQNCAMVTIYSSYGSLVKSDVRELCGMRILRVIHARDARATAIPTLGTRILRVIHARDARATANPAFK